MVLTIKWTQTYLSLVCVRACLLYMWIMDSKTLHWIIRIFQFALTSRRSVTKFSNRICWTDITTQYTMMWYVITILQCLKCGSCEQPNRNAFTAVLLRRRTRSNVIITTNNNNSDNDLYVRVQRKTSIDCFWYGSVQVACNVHCKLIQIAIHHDIGT